MSRPGWRLARPGANLTALVSRFVYPDVGDIIAGKYRLVRLIGEGAMSAVYEAAHVLTSRKVALKLIQPRPAEEAATTSVRFLREAQAAASIGHSTMVDIFDAGEEQDGSLYLTMEHLTGETLESAIRRRSVRDEDLIYTGLQVLDGLAAAHARGFIHRDIKPENVFLLDPPGRNRRVKILDFGLAKRRHEIVEALSVTQRGSVVGTPAYMSPEQARGDDIDERADLWGLAATLFRGFAGYPPFWDEGDSWVHLLVRITTERAPSLGAFRSDLAPALIEVIDRALEPHPDNRWASAKEMKAALAACLDEGLNTDLSLPSIKIQNILSEAMTQVSRRKKEEDLPQSEKVTLIPPPPEDTWPEAPVGWNDGNDSDSKRRLLAIPAAVTAKDSLPPIHVTDPDRESTDPKPPPAPKKSKH
jgi:eukaryotic-like serine/threonine-protein kinase